MDISNKSSMYVLKDLFSLSSVDSFSYMQIRNKSELL